MTATTFFSETNTSRFNTAQVWTGRVLSTVAVLFLTMDAVMHLLRVPVAVQGTVKLGYSAAILVPIGIIQVLSLIAYLYPRTSVLGAIVWTGYLGGAVATHVRGGDPLFSHVLFPVYVAALLWAGLAARNPRVMALFK